METPNVLPSKRGSTIDLIPPQSVTGTSVSTGWVDMSTRQAVQAVVNVGVISSSGVVNAKLEQTTSDGGSAADVTSKAITALTQAGSDSNKGAILNCRSDELDVNNGYRWVRLTITVSGAAALVSGVLQAFDHRYASSLDSAIDSVN
jgi:hypothetical protein